MEDAGLGVLIAACVLVVLVVLLFLCCLFMCSIKKKNNPSSVGSTDGSNSNNNGSTGQQEGLVERLFLHIFPDRARENSAFLRYCYDPTCGGRNYMLKWVFLFRQIWPIDIFIVEKCERNHKKARPA